MRFTFRETILAWGTLAVLLFGATYLLGEAKFRQWQELDEGREVVRREIELAQRLIEQRPVFEARLEQNLLQIRSYPEGQDVVAQLLRMVAQMATESGLQLTSQRPDKEESVGEVFEVTINYGWQGSLEAIIRFLYTLQSSGFMYDVRSLVVTPVGESGDLKGSVSVDCAYIREPAATPASSLSVEMPSENEGAAPPR